MVHLGLGVTVTAAVVYLEACIRALREVPVEDRQHLQARLWLEHFTSDLKTLKLLAQSESRRVEA